MKTFPIRLTYKESAERIIGPIYTNIPREIIASRRERVLKDYGISIEDAESRGGLSVCEAIAVIEDRPWSYVPVQDAYARLARYVRDYERTEEERATRVEKRAEEETGR